MFYKVMMESARVNVTTTTNAPIHWLACKELALVHAKVCCADQMRIANQKDMPLGVGVALDLPKIKMENVFRVSKFFFVEKRFTLQTRSEIFKLPHISFEVWI